MWASRLKAPSWQRRTLATEYRARLSRRPQLCFPVGCSHFHGGTETPGLRRTSNNLSAAGGGEQLGVVDDPALDQFAESLDVKFAEPLIMGAAEYLLVADGPLGHHLEDVVFAIRAHDDLQAAKE